MPLNLAPEEEAAVERLLRTDIVQNEMGAENWDLTEDEENVLWGVIKRLEEIPGSSS